jgi:cation diffusion facilitator CzcD-associated flavoprotein CzcO
MTAERVDFLVIGAGMAGALAVYELAARGRVAMRFLAASARKVGEPWQPKPRRLKW